MVAIEQTARNPADDLAPTRMISNFYGRLAEPLAGNIYRPIGEINHNLGVAALNISLTCPRLLIPKLNQLYIDRLDRGDRLGAIGILLAKGLLVATDGLDGAVARASGLTSEFGAFLDPAVDILGTFSDAQAVKKLASKEKDILSRRIVNGRLAVDGLAILVGGLGGKLSYGYAKKQASQELKTDSPKANATGKLKFAIGAVGTSLIETIYACKTAKNQRRFKQAGQSLTGASILIGLGSVIGYTQTARRNFGLRR